MYKYLLSTYTHVDIKVALNLGVKDICAYMCDAPMDWGMVKVFSLRALVVMDPLAQEGAKMALGGSKESLEGD